jgi:predicted transcriptional regulator
MKKIILAVFVFLLWCALPALAAELKVGDKIVDFKLSAALDDKEYSLSSPEFAGKVVYMVYASTSSADDNDHVSDALDANKEVALLKSEKKYVGLGIGNQKDSLVPNFIIKKVAKRKQEKTGAIILLDPGFMIGNIWGVPHKVATSILIDKNQVVRYIYSGKTPAENIPKLIDLIKKYSAEK